MPFTPARCSSPSVSSRVSRRPAAKLSHLFATCGAVIYAMAVLLLPAAVGAQTAVYSGLTITLGGGFHQPDGVAVDANGNVYVADYQNDAIKEMPAGCASSACVTILGGGFSAPTSVAVDAAGNIYVADFFNNAVKEMPAGCASSACVTILGGGFSFPGGVAVDASGNVYVADELNDAVKEMPAGCASSACVTTFGGGFNEPSGVAVDGSGNIYVADFHNSAVKEMPAGCASSACVTTLGGGFNAPQGVAVDGAGNIYVGDSGNSAVKEMPAGCASSACVTTLGSGFSSPEGVAVDWSGNVFVGDYFNNAVKELMLKSANFFSVPVGSTSTALSIPFTFTSPGTISEVTYGANVKLPATGTCFTQDPTYSVGGSCTVDVQFAPQSSGSLRAAITLLNDASQPLPVVTALIQGTGVAPQVVFSPSTIATLGGGYGALWGVVVDQNGNIYVTDDGDNTVKEVPPGCASSSCVTTVGGGFHFPGQLALDGANNLYAADFSNTAVKEIPPGCASAACVIALGGGFTHPNGVAVDGSGNVYVADTDNNTIKEMPAGCASSACVTTLGGGFQTPYGVTVDGNGNIYVADSGNSAVKLMPAGCGSAACVTTLGGGFSAPYAVTLDAAGNIYVADNGANVVKVIPPGCKSSACVSTLLTNLNGATAVAIDSNGNVYATDTSSGVLKELLRATPPTISFAATPAGQISTDSPKKVTVQNIGNATLTISDVEYPFDFPQDINVPATDCLLLGSIASGHKCTLSADFLPFPESITGLNTHLTEPLSLTSNNLNGSNVTQSVTLKGTATVSLAALTSPAPSTVLPGPRATFMWSSGSGGVTGYMFRLGTSPGANDIYSSGPVTGTSVTHSGLPIKGQTLYARLYTVYESGTQLFADYTFTEATQTAITSPVPGTTLVGPRVTFSWPAATGAVSSYILRLGTTVGSANLYASGPITATSVARSGLPTNGTKIYARLFTLYTSGAEVYADYTFTEATHATMTSPRPNTTLTGGPVTFHWSSGTGVVTGYILRLGTAAGLADIYHSGTITATSVTVPSLPTNGETIYARLYTLYGSSQLYTDYVYTAQ